MRIFQKTEIAENVFCGWFELCNSNVDVLKKVPNVEVSDTTEDAIENKSRDNKNPG